MPSLPVEHNNAKSQNNSECPQEATLQLPFRYGRYLLLKAIARGGMGEVFLATLAEAIDGAERPCVVKVIRREHIEDSSFLARFLDEARIQAQLEHPGVVRVHEASRDQTGKPYVVLEHVEGRNLSEVRLRAAQLGIRIPWPDAVAVAIALTDGLAHVHERTDASGRPLEIVHRDLSPQNVMVAYGGDVKLIDFGTARGENRRCQTVSGIVFAKPGYIAPEVANNMPGGVPADLYAIGIMLWEVLSGRRFLVGDAGDHLVAVGSGQRVPTPVAEMADAPPELDAICQRLTALRIEDRYTSAREASAELVQLLKRAPSMADGQRSVRARIAHLMQRLYPAEPVRTRAEFARLIANVKMVRVPASGLAPSPSPIPVEVDKPADDLLAGTRYRLLGELGSGASGTVYEALHVDLGRHVALKVLRTAALEDPARHEAFRREARAIAQLEHDNIVSVHDFGVAADGRSFLAMEMLEGESVEQRMMRDGPLEWRSAFALGIQACRALEAAHAAGIVHRDIKPANLFICRTGGLRLLDFGVAHLVRETRQGPCNDEALQLIGTPEYMAPEQFRSQTPSVLSDVYSLGVVLYEMVTGARPHEQEGLAELLHAKQSEPPLGPSRRARERRLPQGLDQVILRTLEADVDRRIGSASALRAALERLLDAAAKNRNAVAGTKARRAAVALAVVGAIGASVGLVPQTRDRVLDAYQHASSKLRVAGLIARVDADFDQFVGSSGKVLADFTKRAKWTLGSYLPLARSKDTRTSNLAPIPLAVSTTSSRARSTVTATPATPEAATLQVEEPADPTEVQDSIGPKLERVASHLAQSRDVLALHELRQLGEQSPDDSRVLKAWTDAASRTKAWGEALRVARQWAKVDPSEEARLELAKLLRITGHAGQARAVLMALVAEQPECEEAKALLERLHPTDKVAAR